MNPDDVDDMDFPLPVAVDDFSNLQPRKFVHSENTELYKNWICLYPIYFDSEVPFKDGRRVNKEAAIKNPNVLHIMFAVQKLKLKTCFEPMKRHPKSFDNYGRIRVNLTLDNGFFADQSISSKKTLVQKVSEYLREAQEKLDEVDSSDPEALIQAGQKFVSGNVQY